MSLYVPTAIAPADLDVAQSPYFGGEFAVYLTTVPAILLGEVTLTAPATGAYAAISGATRTKDDIQMAALTPIRSTVALGVTLVGGFDPEVWDFPPPARAANQSFNFAVGYAVDNVLLGTANYPITAVDTGGITGGSAGMVTGVFQLPDFSDYSLVGCTTDIAFNTKSRMAKGVDCGMESDQFIKRGKTQVGELSIGGKLKSFAEGLARFDGLKTTCLLVGLKDGQVTGDRLVFTQWVPNIKPRLPDGDGEAMIDAEGKFAEHLFFVAP